MPSSGDGAVVWITGLPASGKSTLAARARDALGRPSVILDSDVIREVLEIGSYEARDRDRFYRALGGLAAVLAGQGLVVLVAATASRRAYRDDARARTARFVEVWVTTPASQCAARDPKGLYARAATGELGALPGAGAPYEAPLAADVIADGGRDDRAVAAIVAAI